MDTQLKLGAVISSWELRKANHLRIPESEDAIERYKGRKTEPIQKAS
ncbi:MAG TPA: hypothetical protein VE130_03830 [Nitrososphaeraceae archaeon]|nr:hypothetical protein [Nitrososphaeraceae archaeon]